MSCDFCVGNHFNGHYSIAEPSQEEQVNYMNNQRRLYSYSNNYYNHNVGWKSNQNEISSWREDVGPSHNHNKYHIRSNNLST